MCNCISDYCESENVPISVANSPIEGTHLPSFYSNTSPVYAALGYKYVEPVYNVSKDFKNSINLLFIFFGTAYASTIPVLYPIYRSSIVNYLKDYLFTFYFLYYSNY